MLGEESFDKNEFSFSRSMLVHKNKFPIKNCMIKFYYNSFFVDS